MDVEVNLFGPYRETAGTKEATLELADGATVRDAVDALVDRYPDLEDSLVEDGDVAESLSLTVNKEDVKTLDGGDTELADGDTLRFAPPVVGGRARRA